MPNVIVIIPAFNEEHSVKKVIEDIPAGLISEIIVVNNNSSDATAKRARAAGATVLDEPRQGYGFACLKGIDYAKQLTIPPDIVVFMDADYSDFPQEISSLIAPITSGDYDFVIGSRTSGKSEKGSLMPQQVFGNWLATSLIRLFYRVHYTDLGPFRAIRYHQLLAINMTDTTYGWTVEMQLKAAKQNLRIKEVPVSYRKRIGQSKIAGTVKGSVLAGYKIITTIIKHLR